MMLDWLSKEAAPGQAVVVSCEATATGRKWDRFETITDPHLHHRGKVTDCNPLDERIALVPTAAGWAYKPGEVRHG